MQEALEKLNKAEKETLEAKNEKMQAILEQRDIEDRLRDLEHDAKEKEIYIKTSAASELKELAFQHQKELRKIRKDFKYLEIELLEERFGHE